MTYNHKPIFAAIVTGLAYAFSGAFVSAQNINEQPTVMAGLVADSKLSYYAAVIIRESALLRHWRYWVFVKMDSRLRGNDADALLVAWLVFDVPPRTHGPTLSCPA